MRGGRDEFRRAFNLHNSIRRLAWDCIKEIKQTRARRVTIMKAKRREGTVRFTAYVSNVNYCNKYAVTVTVRHLRSTLESSC